MTSSTADKPYNAGRRIRFLAAGIVLVGLLYTGGWYYVANMLETRVAANIAGLQAKGINAACDNAAASGYPFRLGLNCSKVSWVDQAKNVSVSAGAFRSAAQVAGMNAHAVSTRTRELLNWQPNQPGLMSDLDRLRYFET